MRLIKRLTGSQLVRGSALIFLANNFVNFGNFLFNLVMARLLGKAVYGELGSLFSLYVLSAVPLSVFNIYIIKSVSSRLGQKDLKGIKSIHSWFLPKIFAVSLTLFLLFFISSFFISGFLKLSSPLPIIFIGLNFILAGLSSLNGSVLTGMLAFSLIALNGTVEVLSKLALSILVVLANWGLYGALIGITAGGLIRYFMSVVEISRLLPSYKKNKPPVYSQNIREIIPVIITTLILVSFLNADIILVRHFFSPVAAGEYVALSTLSKSIFYAAAPFVTVMFPIITKRKAGGDPYLLPLLGSLFGSAFISLIAILAFYLFPKFIVNLLFGSKYLNIIPYLVHFSFFTAIYALNHIVTYFLLSVSFNRALYILPIFPLLQTLLIFIFHKSVFTVISINILTSLLYLISAIILIWYKEAKNFIYLIKTRLPLFYYHGQQ